ncbi:hypothetical protein B296_00042558 [Ensete ventricosum]|uniref:Uncharacterized protein n=1 Tax=Ensete ventricosum TaxID=4639 RepID=A0A426XCW6_ENSVE|nr:hypothetical protein B296_00042558 [Ensete ventricosum]
MDRLPHKTSMTAAPKGRPIAYTKWRPYLIDQTIMTRDKYFRPKYPRSPMLLSLEDKADLKKPPSSSVASSPPVVAAVFFSPVAAALARLSLPSSFLPYYRSPHPYHPCRRRFLSLGCFFVCRPLQFLLFITAGHPCHLPLQPLQPTTATSFSQPPADLLLFPCCCCLLLFITIGHPCHLQLQPLQPTTATSFSQAPAALGRTHPHGHHLFLAFPPSSLLLACRHCHPLWVAACHFSPLSLLPLLCCCRQLLLPRQRTVAPPPLPAVAAHLCLCRCHHPLAAAVASSHALLIFFPLQPPQPQPPLVGPSITIAPPLRRKLMPLTRQQKKELNITEL